MDEILNAIGKNPDIKLVVYGIIGIVILYVVLRLFKLPLKLLINGIFGVILLYIVNFLGADFGINIGINILTALIAGTLGIPGVIALVIFQLFI